MEAVSIHIIGQLFSRATNFATELKKEVHGNYFHESTLEVHAITLYNTHFLAIVCGTRGDTMNSWKILYSEEFKACEVSHSQVNLYASHL